MTIPNPSHAPSPEAPPPTPAPVRAPAPEGSPVVDVGTRAAALLAAVEVGLGSVLHGLRIPFSGFALSLNQGFFLARVTFTTAHDPQAKALPATVSSLVALLKSLSPAGKRLTPMVGITTQGVLFNLGTLVLGRNILGASVGAVLLALWGFVQPLVIYYAVFGRRMLDVGKEMVKDVNKIVPLAGESVLWAAACLVTLKCVLALVAVVAAHRASPDAVRRYEQKLLSAGRSGRGRLVAAIDEGSLRAREGKTLVATGSAAKGALRDLASPLYLVSLALGVGFLVFVQSDAVGAIWMAARFLSVGFIVFFVVRVLPVERIALKLENSAKPTLAQFGRRLRGTLAQLKAM